MKVTGDFYAYLWPGLTNAEMQTYGNNCNSYIVADALPGGRHVLVDPGMITNETGLKCLDHLVAEIEADDLRIEDVGLIINTHAHPDHYGASEEIRKLCKSQVTIGKGEDEFVRMTSGKKSGTGQIGFELPELQPDFYLKEGELLLGSRYMAEIYYTPGHTKGHIGVYWPEHKIFMAGDLIFYGSTGRVDLPGGSAHMLKNSIERVARLDIEYLFTGHQYGGPGILKGKGQIESNFSSIRANVFSYL
ncbi:MAG: MBL fold metallo-hydrolase [Deltaproteobacteria bacterium]|nr:MBL fold metallo-hydrolase [Deltaproteobacteria bacterium]